MKKNISINISGIIFHIEEDGYEVLKKYLDSINKYFSSFEDSSEILSDIESRIAEIFLTKLNEGKQIITAEDVNSLVVTMGSVSDFKAAEEPEFTEGSGSQSEGESKKTQGSYTRTASKTLYRDQNRKILGGVCAGMANYFSVDAVWIRLIFALFTAAWGFGLLVYIVMWIVVPGSFELEEPQGTKKMFRDNEKKVLGGVSGGLAAYFGIDIIIVRLLFVITAVFGGFGLVAYIVLWLVLPPAVSITDKMQMQGEPVTLSNIESNLKKGLNVQEGEESALVKILLFPFRLLGMILTGLGKIFVPLIEVIRVAFGIVITFTGISLVFAIIVSTGILFGLISGVSVPIHWGVPFNEAALPMEAMSRAIPTMTAVAAFVGAIIPGIMITLLGISVIAKRIVFSNTVGWTIFIFFLLSAGVMSFTIPKIAFAFKEHGEVKIENEYDLKGKTALLKVRETGLDEYDAASLTLKGYEGKEFKLVQYFEAQGNSRQIAIENTKMVDYHVAVEDSVFTFDSNIQFKPDAIFRAQRLKMTLFIPYDYKFVLDDNVYRLVNTYFDWEKRDGQTWVISKEGGLQCVTCPQDEFTDSEGKPTSSLSDFNELELSGLFDVRINYGHEYSVELIGDEREKEKYTVSQHGRTLTIEYNNKNKKFDWKSNPLNLEKIKINITMPDLESLDLKGSGDVIFSGFNPSSFELTALGAIDIDGQINTHDIVINLSGASELELRGEGNTMEATIQGASQLKAYNFSTEDASIEANGASSAKVYVSRKLEMKEGIASKVSYRGDPESVIKE
ncbi:MAG TPA: PspC domain-containing protein [Cyclobacteriaceae bacterium]|nr:PspC domain-containing protein [Cyclobacteriaceae bacterium]